MATILISLGLTLLAVTQVATREAGAEATATLADAQTRPKPAIEARDRGEDTRRRPPVQPRRTGIRPPRPVEHQKFVPRRTPKAVADEAPRAEKARSRGRATPRVAAEKRETTVMRLNHVPAADTAETVREWLESEQEVTGRAAATVVAVVITNDLVVSGSSEQVEAIGEVVHELDRPSPRIRVKAMLVDLVLPGAPEPAAGSAAANVSKSELNEVVAKLKELGDLRVLARPVVLAADNQPAFLQLGRRVPRITATNISQRGRSNAATLENVGTILAFTGRVTEHDTVTLEVDLERSDLGPEEEGTPIATMEDGSEIRTRQVETLTMQTTVSLRSGQTVVLGGMVYQTEHRCGELLLLLQPEIVHLSSETAP